MAAHSLQRNTNEILFLYINFLIHQIVNLTKRSGHNPLILSKFTKNRSNKQLLLFS